MNLSEEAYSHFMMKTFAGDSRERSKAIGQFFTPAEIYEPMIHDVAYHEVGKNLTIMRVIDPFCGDGRLLVNFIREINNLNDGFKVEITAWDIDEAATKAARNNLEILREEVSFEIKIDVECKDAFMVNEGKFGQYDICVTNPPWSSTKSLKAKAFSSKEDYETYQKLAGEYTKELCRKFPEVSSSKSFGTGAINLSRFGLALSMRLVKNDGTGGIVMPSSFAGDLSSKKLRKILLSQFEIIKIEYFPAELKLFAGADQAGISIVFGGSTNSNTAEVISHMGGEHVSFATDEGFWEYSAANGYSIPLGYSEEEVAIIEKLSKFPTVKEEGKIKLGREVDETRLSERLCPDSPYRFIKGFMVLPYQLLDEAAWYYDNEKAPIPQSANEEKVVWRDISRASQMKRIKATLVPEGFVAGNSLGVATSTSPNVLRAFLGILNSRVFEFMARTMLTTNHVSAGVIKRMPLPRMEEEQIEQLARKVNDMLENPDDLDIYDDIEKIVSSGYGLTDREIQIVKRKISFVDINNY
jgi:Alw26I/Eco31I/Esp3I family type II restriction m6 adenine DNA methyltransferase